MKRRSFLQLVSAGVCTLCIPDAGIILTEAKPIEAKAEFVMIPLSRLRGPGRHCKYHDVLTLSINIKRFGLRQPLIVSVSPRPGYYNIVDGLHRAHAAAKAGYTEVLCRVLP